MHDNTPLTVTKRDEAIIRHIALMTFTTFTVLHRAFFLGKEADAVKSTLRRLRRARLILSEQLLDNWVLYRLTKRACRLFDLPRRLARPIGPQTKCEKYAVLWFFHLDRHGPHTLFNPGHYEQFNVDPSRLRRVYFYLKQTPQGPLMGHLVLDHGTTAVGLARRGKIRLAKYIGQGWLDSHIASRLFELTFLVSSASKKAHLQGCLESELRAPLRLVLPEDLQLSSEAFPIPVHIKVVPNLDRLITALKT